MGSDFVDVGKTGYLQSGFAELPLVVVPQSMLLGITKEVEPSSREAIDTIINGLTKWTPKATTKGTIKPEPATLVYEGVDYQDALNKMNDDFLRQKWGDDLPLLPATKERVEWLLKGTDLPRDQVVAKFGPRGGLATVEVIATNAAMVGARPEYMPVIIAGVKAVAESISASTHTATNPIVPVLIVNGPIAKEIGINSSWGMLGPSSVFPAGGSIGRAIETMLRTAGGLDPGTTAMPTQAQPARYTGMVFAEAEDQSPWEPLNVERGFPKGSNTVTVLGVTGTSNACCQGQDASFAAPFLTNVAAKQIAYLNSNQVTAAGVYAILIIPEVSAQQLAEHGYPKKQDVKQALWQNARMPLAEWRDSGILGRPWERVLSTFDPWLQPYDKLSADALVPIVEKPDMFMIVVAGGPHSQHWVWLQVFSSKATTVEIKTPANWKDLLKEAPKFWPQK